MVQDFDGRVGSTNCSPTFLAPVDIPVHVQRVCTIEEPLAPTTCAELALCYETAEALNQTPDESHASTQASLLSAAPEPGGDLRCATGGRAAGLADAKQTGSLFDVLTACLEGVLNELRSIAATRSIEGSRPADLKIVLSLRDQILQLGDLSLTPPGGWHGLSDRDRFRLLLRSQKYATYDDDGAYVGQTVPFSLAPLGALGLGESGGVPVFAANDCAERLRDVNASVIGDDLLRGTYALNSAGTSYEIDFPVGEAGRVSDLDITSDIATEGAGADATTLSSTGTSRLIEVHSDGALRLSGVALTGSVSFTDDYTYTYGDSGGGGGGALWNAGVVELQGVLLSDNEAQGLDGEINALGGTIPMSGIGGAIYNEGTLTAIGTSFVGNRALGGPGHHRFDFFGVGGFGGGAGLGGAVFNNGVVARFYNCTFTGNEALSANGGAGGDGADNFGQCDMSCNGTVGGGDGGTTTIGGGPGGGGGYGRRRRGRQRRSLVLGPGLGRRLRRLRRWWRRLRRLRARRLRHRQQPARRRRELRDPAAGARRLRGRRGCDGDHHRRCRRRRRGYRWRPLRSLRLGHARQRHDHRQRRHRRPCRRRWELPRAAVFCRHRRAGPGCRRRDVLRLRSHRGPQHHRDRQRVG